MRRQILGFKILYVVVIALIFFFLAFTDDFSYQAFVDSLDQHRQGSSAEVP